VAIVHDAVKEMISAHLTLVHVFHAYASVDTPWVAHALSRCTPVRYARIVSVLATHDTTQFGDSICPVCVSTFKCYHLGPQNFRLDHSSSFPSSIPRFLLIAPPSLIINHSINYSGSPHSNLEPRYRKL
jgi:hypothetical protein